MRTIALRFSNNFAPESGTIAEHQKLIDELGYVWYGKLGSKVSLSVISQILDNQKPRVLLIHSGATRRYWAYIDAIQKDTPDPAAIPEYYRDNAHLFKTWFHVIRIEDAAKDVLSKCTVVSSGASLSQASRHSMSPYFIIDYAERNEE